MLGYTVKEFTFRDCSRYRDDIERNRSKIKYISEKYKSLSCEPIIYYDGLGDTFYTLLKSIPDFLVNEIKLRLLGDYEYKILKLDEIINYNILVVYCADFYHYQGSNDSIRDGNIASDVMSSLSKKNKDIIYGLCILSIYDIFQHQFFLHQLRLDTFKLEKSRPSYYNLDIIFNLIEATQVYKSRHLLSRYDTVFDISKAILGQNTISWKEIINKLYYEDNNLKGQHDSIHWLEDDNSNNLINDYTLFSTNWLDAPLKRVVYSKDMITLIEIIKDKNISDIRVKYISIPR